MSIRRAACLVAVAFAMAAPARAQVGESVAAVVNDEIISTYDVRQRMAMLLADSQTQPTPDLMQLVQQEALRSLIEETLQLQEAAQFEIEIPEEQIDGALQSVAAQAGVDYETYRQGLIQAGANEATLRQQIRAYIAWDALVGGRYGARIRIGEDQVDQTLERFTQNLQQTQYRVAEIFFEVANASQEAAALEEAQGVIQQMVQGANFAVMAQQYSDAVTAPQGGDMGYQPIEQFPQEIADQLMRMNPEDVAGPVRSLGGYYIIALIDKRDASSVLQLKLKSIVLPVPETAPRSEREAARIELAQAALTNESCDAADEMASRIEGAFVSDLGTLNAASLQPEVRDAIAEIEPGQATRTLLSPLGAQIFLLCDRQISGPGVPSRDEIRARLEDQRRAMLSRRYLRDLTREAAIDIR